MCVVSNIGEYYKPHWGIEPAPALLGVPAFPSYPQRPDWTEERIRKLRELIDKAREMDALMGELDCEDPEKTAWMQQIEERLKRLEQR